MNYGFGIMKNGMGRGKLISMRACFWYKHGYTKIPVIKITAVKGDV